MGCASHHSLSNRISAQIEVKQDKLKCQIINSINYFMSKNPGFSFEDDDFEDGNKIEKEFENYKIYIKLNIFLKILYLQQNYYFMIALR